MRRKSRLVPRGVFLGVDVSFVVHTSGSFSRSGIRTLSLRAVVMGGAACALLICSAGFAAGMLLGQQMGRSQQMAGVAEMDPVREQFAVDRLGEVSGRLVRLESEARALVKKITALEALESSLGDARRGKPATAAKQGGLQAAGGRVLAPAKCDQVVGEAGAAMRAGNSLSGAERGLDCLQGLIQEVEAVAARRSVALMRLPTHAPVQGYTGSRFGNRFDPFTGKLAFHSGLDFPALPGTPIRAVGAGRVIKSGWLSDYGYAIEIDHGNELITRYAHASRLIAKEGDLVIPGQLIAEVGSTGRSTGPHLHFEIIHQGRYVDPAFYLTIGAQIPNV